MRKTWLIIVPVVIWGLHSWLSEDDTVDPGKDLASRSPAPAQEPSRGLPAGRNGYADGRGAQRSRDWQTPPSHREPAWEAGGMVPGTFPTFSGERSASSQLGGYRFRPSSRDDRRDTQPVQPAYSARQYDPVSPVYGNEPALPWYGAPGQMSAQQGSPLKFRPLEKSKRWTGNYPLHRQGYTPENYGQRAVPQDYGRSTPQPWSPPQGNPMLLYNRLGSQDVYSAR